MLPLHTHRRAGTHQLKPRCENLQIFRFGTWGAFCLFHTAVFPTGHKEEQTKFLQHRLLHVHGGKGHPRPGEGPEGPQLVRVFMTQRTGTIPISAHPQISSTLKLPGSLRPGPGVISYSDIDWAPIPGVPSSPPSHLVLTPTKELLFLSCFTDGITEGPHAGSHSGDCISWDWNRLPLP